MGPSDWTVSLRVMAFQAPLVAIVVAIIFTLRKWETSFESDDANTLPINKCYLECFGVFVISAPKDCV